MEARVSARVLLASIGDWQARSGSAFRGLAAAIGDAVERGDLPAGVLLPAERSLAAAAGVSRGTIVATYDVLREQGVVLRRQGSGTWVRAGREAPADALPELAAGLRSRRLTERTIEPAGDVIDLGISVLTDLEGLDGVDLGLDVADLARAGGGHGYQPLGVPALRRAIAERYTARGLPTTPEQVAVTSGTQHGIWLAVQLLVRSDDVVALESATYPGAIDVASRAGARFVTAATDGGGVRPDHLARLVAEHQPRLVYLVPSAHNPLGTVLPAVRRREVARIVDESDTWLVEDETLSPLCFGGRPGAGSEPLPVAAASRSQRVVTLGSFSKVLWGGLRVGWLRGPEPLVRRVARLRAATDLGGSSAPQLLALRAVPAVDAIAASRRAQLAERLAVLSGLLAQRLPDWSFRPPDGGLSLWVRLPSAAADRFAAAALRHGVAVLPGGAASVDEAHLDHIRLSYSLPPDVLADAVDRLSLAAEEVRP